MISLQILISVSRCRERRWESMRNLVDLLAIGALLGAALPAEAQLWDKNLVVNGDAESGTGVTTRTAPPVKDIPGWTPTGNFTLCQYVNGMLTDHRWMQSHGNQYFAAGRSGEHTSAIQSLKDLAGPTE